MIQHVEGFKFPIGEIGNWEGEGWRSGRCVEMQGLLEEAGFKCRILEGDIRSELWLKVWGSCVFNPVSALTHSTLSEMLEKEETKKWVRGCMREVQEVGEGFGLKMRVELERRLEGARLVGGHKTSMLQDVEGGKGIEIEGICGAVVELGKMVGVDCRSVEAVYVCTKLLARQLEKEKAKVVFVPR